MYVIYRYHAGENRKGRPAYYSKALSLASFLRAAEAVPGLRVLFLHDGPVSEEIRTVMSAAGQLLPVTAGSNRRSYLRAMQIPRLQGWDPASFVFFSEDDYLYLPNALHQVKAAVDQYPLIDYFTPYTITRESEPAGLGAVDGWPWERILSTTSTFGGRVRAVLQDEKLLMLCPFSGGAWDYATCLAYRGEPPFKWPELFEELTFRGDGPLPHKARLSARSLARIVVNVRSHRLQNYHRLLAAPVTNTATHMETEFLAEGHDWEAVARETAEWVRAKGLPLTLPLGAAGAGPSARLTRSGRSSELPA